MAIAINFRVLAMLLAVVMVAPVWAAENDLVNCRYWNGNEIDDKLCEAMRKWDAQERERKAREAATRMAAEEQERAYQADQQAKQAERDRRIAEDTARRNAEDDARQKEMARELQRTQREEAAADARQAAREKQRRSECGADYGKPQVGMSMDRARRCVGAFKLVSQLNRADGVVSTYRAGRLVVHEMGGRIAAWSVF